MFDPLKIRQFSQIAQRDMQLIDRLPARNGNLLSNVSRDHQRNHCVSAAIAFLLLWFLCRLLCCFLCNVLLHRIGQSRGCNGLWWLFRLLRFRLRQICCGLCLLERRLSRLLLLILQISETWDRCDFFAAPDEWHVAALIFGIWAFAAFDADFINRPTAIL